MSNFNNDVENRAKAQSDSAPGGAPVPPMRADVHTNADPAVETPVEARQGFKGVPVLMVLVGGLVLAIIAWMVVEMVA